MSGSGAGQNRVYATILTCQSTSGTVGSPTTGYGTIGVNDSGLAAPEAAHFTKWSFSLLGDPTNYSVTIFGTNDPKTAAAWRQSLNPGQYPNPITVPASSWVKLPGPAEQSGTGSIANPMTSTTPFFQFSGTLLAVRAVITALTPTNTNPCSVAVDAVP